MTPELVREIFEQGDGMISDSARPSVLVAERTLFTGRARVRLPAAAQSFARTVLLEHRTLLLLTLPYIGLGGLALFALGRPWPIRLMNPWFAGAWVCGSLAWLIWQYLKGPRYLRAALEPSRVAGAVLVFLLVPPAQITFQALKQSIGQILGFPADALLHRLDVSLHGGMAWLWLEPLLGSTRALRALDVLYMLWFVALFGFLLWAGWTRFRELRQRALTALLLLWMVGGTVTAAVAASAGPVYYGRVVAGSSPYEELMTRLDSVTTVSGSLFARVNQRGLWGLYATDGWGPLAGISAMPSLHVGFAVLLAVVAGRRSRRLAAVLWAYAILIQLGSVVLGWHYAIDGYAGGLIAAASWSAAGSLCRSRTRAGQAAGYERTRVSDTGGAP
jgi:hypothetical protein